ncbi:hypothetical protein F0562_016908 [Nyssa sinensis]|uniref:Pectate lyase n=1 Tax=Nyssa sinensis TaxID=561372 RepID=A0A5J4ZFT1_9ASTE|nr:hypothetical protein F0562_016908 [Nyssa sinensis]
MLHRTCIVLISLLSSICTLGEPLMLNLTLPSPHPNPDAVVQEVQRRVNVSISRRQMLSYTTNDQSTCLTGNPIDDCWRCDPNWHLNRQRLADCSIGFGQYALGGKGGRFYVVTDSSDHDAVNPKPWHSPLRRHPNRTPLDRLLRQHAHPPLSGTHLQQLQNPRRPRR